MIEAIGNLIRYIVILIFLATLLEMILPHGQFRRYLRMLVGILLILTILSPIQNIMRMAPGWDAPVFMVAPSSKEELAMILQRGEQMREESYKNAAANYRYHIFTVVENLLKLEYSRELLEMKVILDEDPQSTEFGAIKKMVVMAGEKTNTDHASSNTSGTSNICVEEIKISVKRVEREVGLDQEEEKSEVNILSASDEEMKIANYLARYFLLKEEQVEVNLIP